MTEPTDLLRQESHFEFGKNWESYSNLISDEQIAEAVVGLRRLAGGDLSGKRFLDIGCGSGLHALAALRLGASEVVAIDIDSNSVATTRKVLQRHAEGKPWQVFETSVFDADVGKLGTFDVVYSWGVLHHTGDMYRALRCAVSLIRPKGEFIFALYRHTRMCWFWKLEKRWYAHASTRAQGMLRSVYLAAFRLASLLTKGPSGFRDYVETYKKSRGMDFYHDVHDWLGGWPYESIRPSEVDSLMRELGLQVVRKFVYAGTPSGLFGSGCDEFVYSRP